MFLVSAFICTAVQPALAAGAIEADSTGAGTTGEGTAEADFIGEGSTTAESASVKTTAAVDGESDSAKIQDGITAEQEENVDEKDAQKKEVSTKATQENTADLENLLTNTKKSDPDRKGIPCVTAESVTWDGGLLKIPVDLGGYTADDLAFVLRLDPENNEFISTWRYPELDEEYGKGVNS